MVRSGARCAPLPATDAIDAIIARRGGHCKRVRRSLEDRGASPRCPNESIMQPLTLFHSESFPIGRYADALRSAAIAPQALHSLDSLTPDGGALRVVLVDASILDGRSPRPLDAQTAVVGVGLTQQPSWLSDETVYFDLPETPSAPALLKALKHVYQFLYQKTRADT